jgi:class 3 adenylate cyclase
LGDAALVWFAHAVDAVPTMLEIVRRLAEGRPAIPTRAGVNYGHVVWREADVIGRDVNVAARLVDLARPGEVLCTATARAGSDPHVVRFKTRGLALLAGIDRRIPVFVATPVDRRSRACAAVPG